MLPLLLLLLLGIVDFGVVMGAQSQVSNAAREGARAGALTGSVTKATAAAQSYIARMQGATDSRTTVTVTCKTPAGDVCNMSDSISDTGSTVTVVISYLHKWISPVTLGLGPTILLHGESQMRIEA